MAGLFDWNRGGGLHLVVALLKACCLYRWNERMSDTEFLTRVNREFIDSLFNDFGKDNFDEHRFGSFKKPSLRSRLNARLRRRAIPTQELEEFKHSYEHFVTKRADDLNCIYKNLDDQSRQLLVKIISYRALGYRRVKLPLNNGEYWAALERVKSLKDTNDKIDPHFLHFVLGKFDLHAIGYDIKLYFTDVGIVVDFIIEQYAYKRGGVTVVQANEGDTVIDCGACWGDTALYFAHKVGAAGKVYSFEFLPSNIQVFRRNVNLNPNFKDRITLVERAVWDKSNQTLNFREFGPGSVVSAAPLENQTGSTTTIAIDDLVKQQKIRRVDYIKMDIEGAEPNALKGAMNTIKKHRPKLAIAIYHSLEDFVNIPKWLMGLGLDYNFYLGHYTIHTEETVLFAAPK
jgi:FkbM family methyltransferase